MIEKIKIVSNNKQNKASAKALIINALIAKITIRILLRLHLFCDEWSGLMACQLNNGRHPKHEIMKYKEWLLSKIHSNWTILDIGSNDGKMPKLLATDASLVYITNSVTTCLIP